MIDVRYFSSTIGDLQEEAYVQWVSTHAIGWIANWNVTAKDPWYPMIHDVKCPVLNAHGGWSTRIYVKACCEDLDLLLAWIEANDIGRREGKVTYCRTCMRGGHPGED